MPQSLARLLTHIIFSTKDREPFIRSDVRDDLHAYLGGILKRRDCYPIRIGGTVDHVHVVCCLSKTATLADTVKEIKRSSSAWIKSKRPRLQKFHWQAGYGAFSVSQSNLDAVVEYITNQEEHHRKVTFMDEFRAFLKRHKVEYDEKYVWE